MSNNQEIIEARLAAYVDSDLDAQERAEIERHLEQHPQHRRLLEELRKGREMLRGLPRESAPPELTEAFNGQLERSVLLDGTADYEEPRMRVGRWPQVFAVAAIVFLTLGLAGVVFFALPNHKAFQVVDTTPTPKASPTDTTTLATGSRPEGGSADDGESIKSKSADHDANTIGKSGPSDAVALDSLGKGGANAKNGGGNTLAEPHDDLKALAENVSQVQQLQDLLTDNNRAVNVLASSNEAVVLAVRTNNVDQTERELAGYLEPNRIAWERAPERVPAALNSSLALRNSVYNYATNSEAPTPEQNGLYGSSPDAYRQQQAFMKKDEARAPNNEQEKAGDGSRAGSRGAGGGGKPAMDDAAGQKAAANSAEMKRGSDRPSASKTDVGQNPGATVPPAPDHGSRTEQQRPVASDSQVAPSQQPQLPASAPAQQSAAAQAGQNGQNLDPGAAAEGNSNSINNLYVVRGLSRKQAQELTDRLARNGEVRKAELSRRGGDGRGYALNNSPARPDNSTNFAVNSPEALQGAADKAAAGGVNTARSQGGRPREMALKTQEPRDLTRDESQLRQRATGNEAVLKEANGGPSGDAPKPAGAAGPATQPADEIVRKGDALNLRYHPAQPGAADQSEVVRVGDDGTIAPRGLGGAKDATVIAAGKSVSELERSLQTLGAGPTTAPAARVAMARRDVRVERVAGAAVPPPAPPAPAAQAAGLPIPDRAKLDASTSARSAEQSPAPMAGPTTRSADHATDGLAATQPALVAADESVDVVIVVQSDAAPAGNAAAPAPMPNAPSVGNGTSPSSPATQPAKNQP
ncbi:MAG: hypothetical protein JWM97_1821 [Phycisphaerales bacterium]|nr:hypothetical protein [Phycisphaerales bacterium]